MIRNIASDALTHGAVAANPGGFATCPLCHTPDPIVTSEAVSKGADWKCSRCSHPWDRIRLANAAAVLRDQASRRAATLEHEADADAIASWSEPIEAPADMRRRPAGDANGAI
jgi:hypothetical protein